MEQQVVSLLSNQMAQRDTDHKKITEGIPRDGQYPQVPIEAQNPQITKEVQDTSNYYISALQEIGEEKFNLMASISEAVISPPNPRPTQLPPTSSPVR